VGSQVHAWAGDTLTVEQCRQLAQAASPLQQRKQLAASISALQTDNLHSNLLPRVSVNGQASLQSDVFQLPFENPAFNIPTIPKDQYRLTVDVAERLWDGRSDNYQRRQRALDVELAAAQTDVDVFQVREVVTDLFFKALLLQESERVLNLSLDDLRNRLRQAEAQVAEGVALRTVADQVRIQILRTEQQIGAVRADYQTLLAMLGQWTGRDVAVLRQEATTPPRPATPRPELTLFSLQRKQAQLGADVLHLRTQPRVELFAQGGLGRPNPFNAFETGLSPFGIVGVRAAWTPIDWGNTRRDREVLTLQQRVTDAQQAAFEQRLAISLLKDAQDVQKNRAQLAQDEAIIRLQEDIVNRADAQVKNGVMTATDYLAQINLLTQARLTRTAHEIQAAQAEEMQKAKQ
jgi:outer membrane protein TolC